MLASHRCDPSSIPGSARIKFGSHVRKLSPILASTWWFSLNHWEISSTFREVPDCVIIPSGLASQVSGHIKALAFPFHQATLQTGAKCCHARCRTSGRNNQQPRSDPHPTTTRTTHASESKQLDSHFIMQTAP